VSRFVADSLPAALLDRLTIDAAAANANIAIVLLTVDEHGWPHPAMLTTLEIVARDARNVRVVLHGRSRSARNLEANGKLTMVIADERGVFYVKGDALLTIASLGSAPEFAVFNLRVDSVLQDDPAAYENARVTSGITVARQDVDSASVRARLDELLA
jgi:hypothetical protein